MGRQRTDWEGEIRAVFEETRETGEPLTTQEITENVDCARRTAYNRLQKLVDRGVLETKKVGARGRVWWPVSRARSTDALEMASDTEGVTTITQAAQFKSLVEEVSEYAIFVLDADGRVVTWNRGAERIKGYEADEIVGTHFSVFYSPAERSDGLPERNLADAAREGTLKEEGWRIRKDGSRFRAKVTLTPVTEDGDLRGYVKVTQDMTRQYRYQRQLAKQRDELEQELDDVFERIDDGFLAVDDEFRFVYVNERAETFLQRDASELLGETIWETLEPLSTADVRECFEHVLTTQELATCENYFDAQGRWIAATIYPSENGLSVYLRDVTERRERERELERYETIVETVTDGVYALDESYRFEVVNEAYADMVGYSQQELVGTHISEVVGEQATEVGEQRRQKLIAGEETHGTVELDIETATGESLTVESRYALLPSEGDEFRGTVGVVRDITARKERERELEVRVRQQEVITELGWLALESDDIDLLMSRASSLVSETLGNEYTKVLELRPDRDELLVRQGVGWDDGIVGTTTVPAIDRDSQAAHTLLTEEPIVVENLDEEQRFGGPELLTDHGVVSGISTVIGSLDDPWGILGTHDTEHRSFSDYDINFVQSVAHILASAINRHEHERTLEQYETIVETIDDGVYVLDEGSRFTMVNQSYQEMMGYDRSELIGEHASLVVGDDIAQEAVARRRLMEDDERYATLEAKIERADGSHFYAESKFTHLPSLDGDERGTGADDSSRGAVGVVRETTERRRYERELERQREQLAALNDLNSVIRDVTDTVIAQSTREEVESVVCDRLADAETYQFAWIGELDRSLDTVRIKATSGCESLEGVELPLEAKASGKSGYGPLVSEALQSQTVQYRREDDEPREGEQTAAHDDTERPFEALLTKMDVQSSVAIPIVHDETVFGVLLISTDRPDAFEGDEQAAIDHLGTIIGHALASIERKRALMSDEVIELQFRTRKLSESLGISVDMEGSISIEETVEIGDGTYTAYGTVTDDAVAALDAIFEATPNWERMTVRNAEEGVNSFEIHLSEPPVTSAVAAQGGDIIEARIVDWTVHLGFHLPPGADVRKIIELVESEYPETEMVSRKQVKRSSPRLKGVLTEELTDRQRTTIEASYHAGFFEWPRTISGEEVAASLGISPPTFHQHLRAAERKVFEALLS
ncbi:PAS domain S-box protein [Haloferax sp. MBLA0076]|uniref:PAS domain S-box protein n=1 Tax=Haloferax litoreum TaxID=2666140 RepID=A0A6A8GE85_9EURY|nr:MULTISPECIES: PAS domain S-box protein [Haloferax]KAB1192675.1 PAS domain S-box protein [Haloferax sp. CBA1148]MRX21151.1 PAS domain S-box protein [Haloferax litoreum]